jgi:putative beta-lysine N-acetyltransferase
MFDALKRPKAPLARTEDPQPRTTTLSVDLPAGPAVEAQDDPYSDRIRCDHPSITDSGEAAELGEALLEAASEQGRGRVVVLAPITVEAGLRAVGYEREGLMPNFYCGQEDCAVLGAYPDAERSNLAQPEPVAKVAALLERRPESSRRHAPVETRRAQVEDAPEVAALLADTFKQYPTPSGDPSYLAEAIEDGIPFRIVEQAGEPVACASADLIREAKTAELTDCATRPEYRGRGLMQFILEDLIDDLRALEYPTAFTLARAAIPGVNLAFLRLGFELRGTMPQSCRIGEGIEDMNIWSRAV